MTTTTRQNETLPPSTSTRINTATVTPIRHVHRERAFGIGYGNSSGYGTERRYTSEWAQPRFRCA